MIEYFRNKLLKFSIWLFKKTKHSGQTIDFYEHNRLSVDFLIDLKINELDEIKKYRQKAIFDISKRLYDDGYISENIEFDLSQNLKIIRYSIFATKNL